MYDKRERFYNRATKLLERYLSLDMFRTSSGEAKHLCEVNKQVFKIFSNIRCSRIGHLELKVNLKYSGTQMNVISIGLHGNSLFVMNFIEHSFIV